MAYNGFVQRSNKDGEGKTSEEQNLLDFRCFRRAGLWTRPRGWGSGFQERRLLMAFRRTTHVASLKSSNPLAPAEAGYIIWEMDLLGNAGKF
ncbi:MAG: hypothetical protein Q9194_003149 [Teloschistes cf. exilis]